MSVIRRIASRSIVAVAIILLFGKVIAQEADDESVDESEDVEEIIVVAPKPGDRRLVDKEYEDPTRARLLKEFHEMQADEEEYEWRKSAALESPSRIKWGYDPRDEYQMRNRMDLEDLPWEKTKPATVFRFEF